ncbi:MAG: hypothetical protein U5K69_21245 [Balneolaceae bacterium]|nr:hypothetical protein [Balneolaceae bacterium]
MKKIILTFLIFGCISTLTFAQSSFLEKGQNGFGISGGFSTNENISGFSGGVGYSFSGIFDLGASISRFGFDQQLLGEDLNATVISPFISFLPIKQDEATPVSFALNGSYQKQFYSNDALSNNDIDMSGNFFTIGASLFTDIDASDAMKIQPRVGVNYITGETKIEDSTGSQTESDNSTVFNLGLSLIFDTSPSNSFVVTPSLGFQEDVTTFGLSLSFVLPQN